MYFFYQSMWTGGHCVMGSPFLAQDFYFAEGTTRAGFHEWLTIQNPNAEEITVDAVYQLAAGQGANVTRQYKVGAQERATVFVEHEVGAGKDVSIQLSCADPHLPGRAAHVLQLPERLDGRALRHRRQ